MTEQVNRWREANPESHNRHVRTENRRRYALAKARRTGLNHEVAELVTRDTMEVQ